MPALSSAVAEVQKSDGVRAPGDAEVLGWLEERVAMIYLSDGRILEVRGNSFREIVCSEMALRGANAIQPQPVSNSDGSANKKENGD